MFRVLFIENTARIVVVCTKFAFIITLEVQTKPQLIYLMQNADK